MSDHTPTIHPEEVGGTPVEVPEFQMDAPSATTEVVAFLCWRDEIAIDDILLHFRDDVGLSSTGDSTGSGTVSGSTGVLNFRILNPGEDWVDGTDLLDSDFDVSAESENRLHTLSAQGFKHALGTGVQVNVVDTLPSAKNSRRMYRGQRLVARLAGSPANIDYLAGAIVINPFYDLEG